MSRRLLLIDDGASGFARELTACGVPAPDVLRCDAKEWGSATSGGKVHLLVPVVFAGGPFWTDFFTGLSRSVVPAPVLAILGAGTGGDLLSAAARAADDFMVWGVDRIGELRTRITRLLGPDENVREIAETLSCHAALGQMLGDSPSFMSLVARIPIVARSNCVVLIQGETGSGKELCARAVHHMSERRHQPFIPVDCAALPDHLLENELFGHTRGAFTDAHRDQIGLVTMADGGTLFLDEIDSLAPPMQAKLLRVIEERAYRPLGSDRFVRANIRIIAASNRPLDGLVQRQQFRSDLYFRLNVLSLSVPPLRARRGDIPILARHFLRRIAVESAAPPKVLAPASIDKLVQAPWPGNVRELRNVLQQAFVFSEGSLILPAHLPLAGDTPAEPAPPPAGGFRQAKRRSVDAFEHDYVETLLRKHHGNITQAAREAGKDRRALARLIQKHGLDRRSLAAR
jgi:two-component system response regulator GlrR